MAQISAGTYKWPIAGVSHSYSSNGGPVAFIYTPDNHEKTQIVAKSLHASHWVRCRLILTANNEGGPELYEIVNSGYKYGGVYAYAVVGAFTRQVWLPSGTTAIYLTAELSCSYLSDYWRYWGRRSVVSLETKR